MVRLVDLGETEQQHALRKFLENCVFRGDMTVDQALVFWEKDRKSQGIAPPSVEQAHQEESPPPP